MHSFATSTFVGDIRVSDHVFRMPDPLAAVADREAAVAEREAAVERCQRAVFDQPAYVQPLFGGGTALAGVVLPLMSSMEEPAEESGLLPATDQSQAVEAGWARSNASALRGYKSLLNAPKGVLAAAGLSERQLRWLRRWWGLITQFTGLANQQRHQLSVLAWQAGALFADFQPTVIAAATGLVADELKASVERMRKTQPYNLSGDVPKFAMQMQICERVGHRGDVNFKRQPLKSTELGVVLKVIMDHRHLPGNAVPVPDYFNSEIFAKTYAALTGRFWVAERLEPLVLLLEKLQFIRRRNGGIWIGDPNRFDPSNYDLGERPALLPTDEV